MQGELIYPAEPIRNHFSYALRSGGKVFSFVFFGIGSILLSIILLPAYKLIFRDKKTFSRQARKLISFMFRFFIRVMTILSVARIKVFDKTGNEIENQKENPLRSLSSCIVVANHPSLLDVVMIISQIPNADVIANAYLDKRNILTKIVHMLYITSNVPYDELVERCKESIADGNVLIIFPEGTRSLPTGQNQFKKGAARLALAARCAIVPIYIGGNDKIGLRKKDSLFLMNPNSCYKYHLFVKEKIVPDDCVGLSEPIAARRLISKVKAALADECNVENRL